MNPIREAAEEIADTCHKNGVPSLHIPELERIITRHLYPAVKLDNVQGSGEYWIRTGRQWQIVDAFHIHAHHDQIDEIRGPIPSPDGHT